MKEPKQSVGRWRERGRGRGSAGDVWDVCSSGQEPSSWGPTTAFHTQGQSASQPQRQRPARRPAASDAVMLAGAEDVLRNDGRLNLTYADSDVTHAHFSSAYAICAVKAGKK